MSFRARHCRHLIQLVCLALLAATLLWAWRPALLRAMSADPASDICSVMGSHADASAAVTSLWHESGTTAADDRCDTCCGAAVPWAPAVTERRMPSAAVLPLWPALLLAAPHTLSVWASALARAPPRSI